MVIYGCVIYVQSEFPVQFFQKTQEDSVNFPKSVSSRSIKEHRKTLSIFQQVFPFAVSKNIGRPP